MPDKKLTDSEIVKALKTLLELVLVEGYLQRAKTISKALDLINRLQKENKNLQERNVILRGLVDTQKAENERLQNILICFMDALGKVRKVDDIDEISLIPLMSELNKQYRAELKAEAYKECIEKVKKIWGNYKGYDFEIKLNKFSKELVGE